MNQELLVLAFQSVPYLAALLLGLLVPIGIVLAAWLAERWTDSSKIAVILGVVIFGHALGVLLGGRIIYSMEEINLNQIPQALGSEQGRGVWAGRFTHALILFVSLGEIFRWVTGRRTMPAMAKQLWLGFMLFYIASYWVGVAFATSREIPLSWIYAPIAFTALALLSQGGMNKEVLGKLEWVLIGVLAASLIGAVALPGMTIERGYTASWIPGFNLRLHGFAEHANSLGMIAAMAVILQLSPYVRPRPNLVFFAIAMAALLFTQSKTAWVVGLVGVALVRFEYLRGLAQDKFSGQFSMLLVGVGSAIAALAFVVLMITANMGLIDRFLKFEEAMTFTGRTRIWEISWNEFMANPLFGYGPALWDMTYRYQNNFMAAGQAHNQFFQTVGQAGLLGLLSLLWYVYLMGRNCFFTWRQTSGLAMIAFLSLMIRCVAESPMQLGGLSGLETFTHMLAFTFAAALVALPSKANSSALALRSAALSKNK